MKLQDQVVSLELATKMKELGFEQESLFYWIYEYYDKDEWTLILSEDYCTLNPVIPAYAVAELGEFLPTAIEIEGKVFDLFMGKDNEGKWFCDYEYLVKNNDAATQFLLMDMGIDKRNEKLADAMAETLTHLKENNLI